jgi:hypothetical protein
MQTDLAQQLHRAAAICGTKSARLRRATHAGERRQRLNGMTTFRPAKHHA